MLKLTSNHRMVCWLTYKSITSFISFHETRIIQLARTPQELKYSKCFGRVKHWHIMVLQRDTDKDVREI